MSIKKNAYLGLSLLAILALGVQGFAQAQQEPADITAYRAIAAEKDPAKNAALCEKFFAETGTAFKESIYREPCFQLMFQDYSQLQNVPKILETADRMPQLVPKIRPEVKEAVYATAMQVSVNNLKDTKKGVLYAEHTLGVNPANLNSLIFLSTTIVENLPMEAAAKEAALSKVVDYANKVLATKKPEGVTDSVWNPILAQQQANIGYVHLIRKNYETSIKTYEESLKLNPKADTSWYRMGLAHEAGPVTAALTLVKDNQDKDTAMFDSIKALNLNIALPEDKAKFDELQPKLLEIRKQGDELDAALDATLDKVIHAFVSAVALAGPVAEPSQKKLETAYKNRFTNLDGLPDMIAKRKAELGKS